MDLQSIAASRLVCSEATVRLQPHASTSGRACFSSTTKLEGRNGRALRDTSHRSKLRGLLSRAVAEGRLMSILDTPVDKLFCKIDSARGLVTSKPIAKGQAILSVPASHWITSETVAKSDIAPFVSNLQPWLQVALLVLHEKAKPRSLWQAYIESLPQSTDSPLFWSELELEDLLNGTQLIDSVYGYRDFFQGKYEELESTVFSQHRNIFSETAFSAKQFVWAASILRGKVHPPLEGDNLALIPLADMIKHQRGQGAVWKISQGGFGRGDKALVVEAQRDYDAGETLTMDYGPDKQDSDLFLNYGVMDDFVTKAGFALNLELPGDDRFADDKADILELNGLSERQEFILTTDSEPTEDLLAYLRLMNLQGADCFLLESLFRNEAWGHLQKPVSLGNETAVFTSMIEGCRDALAGYGSSIAEDKGALRSAEPGSKLEKALRIRIGEKEALDATLQFFKERVGRLDKLEYYQERRLKGLGLLDEDGRSTFDSFFKDGIA